VLTVPVAALHRYRQRRHTAHVTVMTASGTEEDREVKVGVTNRVSAEIVSGLKEGEKVVAGSKAQPDSGSRDRQRGQGNRGNRPRIGFP